MEHGLLLTLCAFAPAAAALLILLIPRSASPNLFRLVSLAGCGVSLVLSLMIWQKAAPRLKGSEVPVEWNDLRTPEGKKNALEAGALARLKQLEGLTRVYKKDEATGKLTAEIDYVATVAAATLKKEFDRNYAEEEQLKLGAVRGTGPVLAVGERKLAVITAADAAAEIKRRGGTPAAVQPGADMAVVHFVEWIPSFKINYFMGVDGLSLPLILLTTVVAFLSMIASWHVVKAVKAYCILYLLLLTGMLGVFMAMDLFLFYVFWEVMLLPMYFLIGIWGGPRKEYAAIKFFLYTLAGSVLILIAMLAFYFHPANSTTTFDLTRLPTEAANWSLTFQLVMFVLLYIGFAIKVPVFPFHTWLPDAHVEAPTPISMILAGVLLKMGGYGLFRISYPLCPQAAAFDAIIYGLVILGVINIVYGAFVATAQTDFKRLVAYSSVSHMGYCLLGLAVLTPMGMVGSYYQMLGHGISSAAMFFTVGVIYERAHHRDLNRFGGIALQMPMYSGLAMVAFFASLGLPGLCGFPGEALTFFGAFPVVPVFTCIAVTGVVLTAVYILWTIQRVYLGKIPGEPEADAHGAHGHDDAHGGGHGHDAHAAAHGSHDAGHGGGHDDHAHPRYQEAKPWENGVLMVLAGLAVVLGVFPAIFINMMSGKLTDIINMVLPYAAK